MTTTLTALETFNQGKLAEAIELAQQDVKQHPGDIHRRNLLCELWCFEGQIERVDKQLETIGLQDPTVAVAISLFRQLVRAELARQECWKLGRPPELLGEPTELVQLELQAWLARREGNLDELRRILEQVEDRRPQLSGTCNGTPFSDFRDLNDFTSFFFETLTSTGKYYWVPFDTVESLTIHAPKRPREILWCRATMIVRGGPDGEVYLPTTYLDSAAAEPMLQLSRGTDWRQLTADVIQGVGRRMFFLDEEAISILESRQLEFQPPDSPG